MADVAAGLAAEEKGDAESAEAARGRDARVRLVNSFAERVVNIAQWKCNRVGRWDVTFREETMQAGMLGLTEAIVDFAKLPADERRGGVWGFAQRKIGWYVGDAAREEFLAKTIRQKGDRQSHDLGRYFSARRELAEQYKRSPSDGEIAEVLHITFEHAYYLRQLATRDISIFGNADEETGEPNLVYAEQKPPTNSEMEILIERALEFFPSNRQAMMRLRFGIGDSPQMTVGEIAEALDINVASVSAAFSRDKEILAELVTSLSTNSLDYDDLRTRGQFNGRNVITMFHLLGVPLPKEAHLQELRERASWHLGKIIESERDRQVVCELYGLGDSSQDRTHKEIAAKFGMSKQNVRVVEARVLKQLAVASE